ncbi:MAG: CCA tRNA nucleotidyltransferase [Verrucomicrobia bacterium]|nr:CCA tRNA nucleotidyltransferase [Verrucomicrobiota bacterium]
MSLREVATELVRRLQATGATAYWVGGCVRDQLRGQQPADYDIATSARPEQIERLFPQTIAVGRKFGVIIVLEAGHPFQVATFRAEAEYQDGRHPDQVTFADARADARRRDFTVNGLFFDPVRGQLFDWVEGEADLRARVIRTIGEPGERFAEDHLRLLRAVRFAAQLDFVIEPATGAAVQRLAPSIRSVSAERVREELLRAFRPPHAGRGLRLLRETGLLAEILPELVAAETCEQPPEHHPEGTVFAHLIRMLEQLPPDSPPSLPWAVVLHDIGKPATFQRDPESGAIHFYGHEKIGAVMAEAVLRRLKFPRKQTEEIVACVRQHMQFKDVRQMRKATLRRLLLRPTFPVELELHRLDCLGSHGQLDLYDFLVAARQTLGQEPHLVPPLVTGRDLLALGLAPGPALGALLAEIRDKQLQDELRTREEACEWAAKRIAGGGECDGPQGS